MRQERRPEMGLGGLVCQIQCYCLRSRLLESLLEFKPCDQRSMAHLDFRSIPRVECVQRDLRRDAAFHAGWLGP